MTCTATHKTLVCDWSHEHRPYAHIDQTKQIFWTDAGISWSTDWVFPYEDLHPELQKLVNPNVNGWKVKR